METWFSDQIHDAEYFSLDSYSVYRKDRCSKSVCGCVFVVSHEEELKSESAEMIWVKEMQTLVCRRLLSGKSG